jgi:hypothetical protein
VTREEWLQVRVGNVIIDRKLLGHPRREVLAVNRHKPRHRGRRTRTILTVWNLKEQGKRTTLWSIEDTLGKGRQGERFEFAPTRWPPASSAGASP